MTSEGKGMTDKLVENLRKCGQWGCPVVDYLSRPQLMAEAADRIEALTAERDKVREQVSVEKEENRWAYIMAGLADRDDPSDIAPLLREAERRGAEKMREAATAQAQRAERNMADTAILHPEDSPSRGRCHARAREASYIRKEIRALDIEEVLK